MGQPTLVRLALVLALASLTACNTNGAANAQQSQLQPNDSTTGSATGAAGSPASSSTGATTTLGGGSNAGGAAATTGAIAATSTASSSGVGGSLPAFAESTGSGLGGNDGSGGTASTNFGGMATGGTTPAGTQSGLSGGTSMGGFAATGGESAGGGGGATAGGGAFTTGTGGGSAGAGADAGAGGGATNRPARVLLYSFSTLDIPSVPAQLALLRQQLESWQYEVDESEDPAVFTDENLAQYAAVGMINTCFSPFGANQSGESQSQALQNFLQQGGGLFGTHCADVTFQSANPPALYNQLLGGRASSQNFEGNNTCRKVEEHPTTAGLPDTFSYSGNLDGTDFIADDTVVLVRCTWGDAGGTEVAVSWVRNEGPGRVFFTNFGKVDADLTNPTIGEPHILSGLAWVLGL